MTAYGLLMLIFKYEKTIFENLHLMDVLLYFDGADDFIESLYRSRSR